MEKINIFWFRRDLRLEDNAGLYHALKGKNPVLPVFIFDNNILDQLPSKNDNRVDFIHRSLADLKKQLNFLQSDLLVLKGNPLDVWETLIQQYSIEKVYTNKDYEPYAKNRDKAVETLLKQNGIELLGFKDHIIFDDTEVLKEDGKPYTVFTPYSKKWKEKLNDFYLSSYPTEKYYSQFQKQHQFDLMTLEDIGFQKTAYQLPSTSTSEKTIKEYATKRNFPALDASSKFSIHFRFGTISIRVKVRKAKQLSETWLNELIWRDFYIQIMAHFPYAMDSAFKPLYNRIEWRNNTDEFAAWCDGKTGYPIVDAGMRELNTTGFMHNRVRMIVASFLCKHLLIDWRWGEAYFAEKLNDFELASNNGGWQWAAGSGVDAAPYFRIFNPHLQTERFDPQLEYIRRWVPEFDQLTYPRPIVEHTYARKRCLDTYKIALSP